MSSGSTKHGAPRGFAGKSTMLDPTHVSALNANRLIKERMTGIAMRKQGLTESHYLSPLTVDAGRD